MCMCCMCVVCVHVACVLYVCYVVGIVCVVFLCTLHMCVVCMLCCEYSGCGVCVYCMCICVVCVCCVYVYILGSASVLLSVHENNAYGIQKRVSESLELALAGCHELSDMIECWKLNSANLQEHQVLLTTFSSHEMYIQIEWIIFILY